MANNIGKKQIATYENKVVEIVPEYKQKGASKETITITKTSVIQEIYAPYSNNEQTEGMYILAHTINDSNYRTGDWNEYEPHQLVAKDDLNYRFLLPTGEDNTSPTYNALLALCVDSSNTDRTISRDEGHNTYETTLTPKTGYSKVPAGRVEKQKGNDTWESVYSWNTPLDSVTIRILDVDGNLRFVFNSNCIYELTVYTTIDGVIQPNPSVIEGICETPINVDNYAQSIPGKTFVNITKDGTPISGEQDFCRNTSIYVNYTTNEYTVTNNIDPNCATVEISNPTPEYGDTVDITITKTLDKANIGAGSISMVGADNPIYSWNKIVGPISYRVNSVIGSITIDAECGDPANHPVQLEWYNDEEPESNPVITSINVSHGSIIHPNDSDCTSTFTLPTGYEIKRSIPDMDSAITITDDNTVIQYHYGLKKYKVIYTGDSTVTINISESDEVKHGEAITTRNVYTIESGYQNATATIVSGTATGASTDNGSVTVTGVTSNVTVRISADSIPTHNYCVSFSIEQAGTIGGDEPYCSTIQEGTCHEDISYSLNSGYEIYGEIPSQITINADNTIDVCNITEDVNLVIPVRLVTHTVKYCLTDGLGISLIGAQGQCITKNVVHGLNSTQGFSLASGYNSVIVDNITPQDKPYNIDYGNNTININNITENVEIWMHAGAIPDQNVTFKLFIDGVEQPDRETTRSVAYGSTANNAFRSLGIVIDRTDINVTADVAGVTTSYVILSDAAIGVSGTPITEATVITTYLKSVPQKEVLSIEVTSSKMDAMGGVVFNGKINYSDETFDIITDQEEFNQKFEIRDSNNNLYDTTVVNVHDYDFEPTRNSSSSSVKDAEGNDISGGEKSEIQKTKLNLENTDEDDVRYSLTRHNYTNRDITISLNNSDKSVSLTIPLRNEKYGYYKGGDISSTSDTSQLDKNYWLNNNYLTNFGDSVEMYKAPSDSIPDYLEGLDIYNKDVTPYYITGTYIGEDPLENLSGNKHTIIGLHKSYNTINSYINEHYHITWGEQIVGDDLISGKAFRKGCIFIRDNFTNSSGICGGIPPEPSTDVCSTSYSDKSVAVLEALGTNYNNNNPYNKIQKDIDYDYIIKYNIPEHNYGIDSVSYYHIEDSPYRVEVENSIFKDEDEQDKQWSYPLHINTYILSPTDTDIYYLSGIGADPNTGAGPTLGMIRSIRWNKNTNSYASYPSDLDYKDDSYNIYFDYNNKVDLYSDESNDYLTFSRYNSEAYNPLVSNLFNNVQLTSYVDPFYIGKAPYGRIIDAYCTFMSSETLIRPIVESDTNDIKFVVLNSAYNNRGNVSGNNTQNSVKEISIRDYCAIQARRCRFISEAVVYDLLNQGYLEHRDDAIQGTVNINNNNYVVPAYVNYPYNMADDYNFDYEHIWVPDNEEYPDNGKKVKGELIYHPNTQEWQVAIYRPETETESARYEYRNIDPDILSNEENFSRNIYNVSGVTQYRQCYNNPNSEDFIEESPNFYAHNDSDAKFAVCTYDFHTGNSARFFKQGLDVTADILRAKVTNVTRERIDLYTIVYKFVTCDPVSNISEVEDGKNVTYVNDIQLISSENGKYYYRETLNNSDSGFVIYTNASEIKLTMANLDENNYPYGLGNVTAILDDGVETKSWNYEELVYDNELMHFDQLSGDHKLAITVSSASHPEYNRTYQGEDRIELSQVLTEGNVIRVTCIGNHLTKQFLVPFGGSCSRRPNHANSSGIDLSWEELFKYYLEGYQDYTLPFTNKGNSLKVINLFNESGDTIVGYVDLSNL